MHARSQAAHACRAAPTVCHVPRCLRIVGGDGGQRRCRVGVDEALRRRRRACGGTEARLRWAPCHAMPCHTLPYHTYHSCVQRAACGVRRAACGVRRAACDVRPRRCACSAHPADGMGGGDGRVPAKGREAATAEAAHDPEAHATQDAQRRLHWTYDRGQAWGQPSSQAREEGWGAGFGRGAGLGGGGGQTRDVGPRHPASEARRGLGTGLGEERGTGLGRGRRRRSCSRSRPRRRPAVAAQRHSVAAGVSVRPERVRREWAAGANPQPRPQPHT